MNRLTLERQFVGRTRTVTGALAMLEGRNGQSAMAGALAAWSNVGALYDLDFVNDRYSQNRLPASRTTVSTFARSLAAYDLVGATWQKAAVDTPRLLSAGIHIEPAVVNQFPNSLVAGAVAGTPGTLPTGWSAVASLRGLSRTLTLGSSGGIPGIFIRMYGTATSSGTVGFNIQPGSATPADYLTPGQVWSGSLFLQRTDNTTPFAGGEVFNLLGNNTSGSNVDGALNNTYTLSSTLTRFSRTRTISNAAAVRCALNVTFGSVTSGQSYDVTVFVGLPQIELGSIISSPVETPATDKATRPSDVLTSSASVTTCTISATATMPGYAVESIIAQWDDGTENNRVRVERDSSRILRVIVTAGGVEKANLNLGTIADGATTTVAASFDGSAVYASRDAGVTYGYSAVASSPGTLTTLRYGSAVAGATGEISLGRVSSWPYAIVGEELLKLTGWVKATFLAGLASQISTRGGVPATHPSTQVMTLTAASSWTPTITGTTIATADSRITFLGGAAGLAGVSYPLSGFQTTQNLTYSDGSRAGLCSVATFRTDSKTFETEWYANAAQQDLRLFIDGKLSSTAYVNSDNSGGRYTLKIDTGIVDGLAHNIRLQTNGAMLLGRMQIETGKTLYTSTETEPYRFVVAGDSITEGTGADLAYTGYAQRMAQRLGFIGAWQSGFGGTGYRTAIAFASLYRPGLLDTTVSGTPVSGRLVADVAQAQADVLTIAMSINDDNLTTFTTQDVIDCINTVQRYRPQALIYVLGPFNPLAISGGVNAKTDSKNDKISAAVAASNSNVRFIDVKNLAYTLYDATHPDQPGHNTIGDYLATVIAADINARAAS